MMAEAKPPAQGPSSEPCTQQEGEEEGGRSVLTEQCSRKRVSGIHARPTLCKHPPLPPALPPPLPPTHT